MQMAFSFEALLRHTWLLNRILPASSSTNPTRPTLQSDARLQCLCEGSFCLEKASLYWAHWLMDCLFFYHLYFHNPAHTVVPVRHLARSCPRGCDPTRDGCRSDSPRKLCSNLSPGDTFSLRWARRRCSWHLRGKHICCCYWSDVSSGDFVPFPFFLLNHLIWLHSSSTAHSPSLRTS